MLTTTTSEATLEGGLGIKENDRAPFSGVLIPEWQYRELALDALTKSQFEVELSKCQSQRPSSKDEAMWFGAGALLSTVLILFSKK
jgi:hypothetical protein